MTAEFQAWWEREGCRIVGDPVDYAGPAFEAGRRTGPSERLVGCGRFKSDYMNHNFCVRCGFERKEHAE